MADLLGLPERAPVGVRVVSREIGDGFTLEDVVISCRGDSLPATRLRPSGASAPCPAVLYCHAHGNAWEIGRRELMEGRPALTSGPYGPVLARAGYTVLCLDMPGHGARLTGESERALSASALWAGGTLMGQMIGDLRAGFDVLHGDPEIDASRIATLGLSMGATHAYWLAALEPRVSAVVQLAVLADMRALIAAGHHVLHGPYMTVPGLLAEGDLGDIAGLVAPRPQFVGLGGRDPLTPEPARSTAVSRARAAYERLRAGPALVVMDVAEAGHEETPAQRHAVLRFLDAHLGAPSGPQETGARREGA